jgi:hypothetical protein
MAQMVMPQELRQGDIQVEVQQDGLINLMILNPGTQDYTQVTFTPQSAAQVAQLLMGAAQNAARRQHREFPN